MAITILFPAFVSEYSGTEETIISGFDSSFRSLLKTASDELKTELISFDFETNNFLNDELKSQYISYIYSCSVSDILSKNGVNPAFVSGYSMGIYAALYYCRAISFEGGLNLIKSAWAAISSVTGDEKYGMGMIIGLDQEDIKKLLKDKHGVEICNQNNRHTFIISGSSDDIQKVLEEAKNEGALRTNLLPVSKPYHSRFLKETSPVFSELIGNIEFNKSQYKYISAMDQRIIVKGEDLRNEVIVNLWCRMNWLETMNKLIARGSNLFFECGAGDSLVRNNRFVEGEQKSFSVSKIDKFLEAGSGKSEV